jgi:hypothetical protein
MNFTGKPAKCTLCEKDFQDLAGQLNAEHILTGDTAYVIQDLVYSYH